MSKEWQIWQSDDGVTFSTAEGIAEQLRNGTLAPGARKIASITASSHNDAMRQYHEAMGWEPYKPMLREDGSLFPEDEAEIE